MMLTKTGWELHLCDKFFTLADTADNIMRDLLSRRKEGEMLSDLTTREGILIHEFGVGDRKHVSDDEC